MKNCVVFLMFTLGASAVLAEPPTSTPTVDASAVTALVHRELLAPLKKAEGRRRKFSRAMPVPEERRVRVLSDTFELDARGEAFVRFSVDERSSFDDEDKWLEGRFVGCVYLDTSKVFVQLGDLYRPAASLRGRDSHVVPDVCRSAAGQAAKS